MIAFESTAAPRKSIACRLRKKPEGRAYLIRFTDVFEMDPLGCLIWETIDGIKSVPELMLTVAARTGMDPGVIADVVVGLVTRLAERGLLELGERDSQPAERDGWEDALEETRSGADTRRDVSEDTQRKVSERMFQIFHEAARVFDEDYSDASNYRCFVDSVPKKAILLHLREELGFVSWRFDSNRNELVMKFDDSTYTGDVDHRR